MIDIETLGNTPEAAMLSIGIVPFNSILDIGPKVLYEIYLKDALQLGKLSAETLQWWTNQPPEQYKKLITSGTMSTSDALMGLKGICDYLMMDEFKIWANGPDFDLKIIAHKLDQLNITPLWVPWNQRCVRTIKAIDPTLAKSFINPEKHDPVQDCLVQINQVCAINEKYKLNLI